MLSLLSQSAVGDLNAFFLKFVLWHPPRAPIVSLRLVLWWLWSVPAIRELYSYVDDPKQKRIGAFLWLSVAIAFAELLIIVRFSAAQFPHLKGHPTWVLTVWPIGIVSLILFTIFYFYVFKTHLKIAPSRPPSPLGSPKKLSPERSEPITSLAHAVEQKLKTPRKRAVSTTKRS